MPIPIVEPIPPLPAELRFGAADDAQETSYFAASARMASLAGTSSICSTYVLAKTASRRRVVANSNERLGLDPYAAFGQKLPALLWVQGHQFVTPELADGELRSSQERD